MKKVLHFLWSGSIGGSSRALYLLVRSQMRMSKFLPTVSFVRPEGYYVREIEKIGCEVVHLDLKNGHDLAGVLKVKKIIQEYPIHHFHSAEIPLMFASFLCKDAVRVYTHRGGVRSYRGRKMLRYKIAGWYLRNQFHGFSGNTKHACNFASSLYNIELSKWHVTYNGVDFSLLYPRRNKREVLAELGWTLNRQVIVGTSVKMRDWKRVDLLLKACSQLKNHSLRILIVGNGQGRCQLQDLAQDIGIADRTIFTGLREHVGDYISLMDIFVLPSSTSESFGNSVVEAMSLGIPVVVFKDGGGLLEHVKDGVNGYIVSSTEELSERLEYLIRNKEIRIRLGQKAKEFVTTTYTLENMVSSYDRLYELAIREKSEKERKIKWN